MGMLTPDQYRRVKMPDLVAMTWDRIERHEREHYGLLLVKIENGELSADEQDRLDDLERRRDVQLSRLMPADAHDEEPGKPGEHPEAPDDAPDGAADGHDEVPNEGKDASTP